jgi:hypothetical protein
MTAQHTVTVAEHTVYDAVCATCPWTAEGFVEQSWAEHAAQQHEKTGHVAGENETEGA